MIRLKVNDERITLRVAPAVVVERGEGGGEPYEGAYEVTPRVEATVLRTEGKTMEKDLTVKKIPYYETSNELGETVYIAAEV